MTDRKRSKITDVHREEAARLKSIWDDGRPHRTQAVFGEHYGLGNQANVGHYLNGRSALNAKAAAAFATELGCSVADFSPRVADELALLRGSTVENDVQKIVAAPAPASAIPYSASRVKEVPVVGKGSGGAMPERIWTDGDYPVGKTGECADIATNDPHAFLVGVDGPSMIPRFNPSEFALVEPGTDPELEDDVLVRLTTGETMIKRLLSRRDGWRFGSYNNQEVLHYGVDEVTWVYYIAHPVPRRKIKSRC